MKIKAVMFDVIGTTVSEYPDTIQQCFQEAFAAYGVGISDELIRQHRGKDKLEIINSILTQGGHAVNLANVIYDAFRSNVHQSIANFKEADDATTVFRELKSRGILIGLGTGLERSLLMSIISHVNWQLHWFDYIGVGPEHARQRPHPDMIIAMQKKFNIEGRNFLKVGDTVADIQEGRNALVKTAAILSGTQQESVIREAKPDYVITDLMAVITLLAE
jgi:phosphonatase-like hydrolase